MKKDVGAKAAILYLLVFTVLMPYCLNFTNVEGLSGACWFFGLLGFFALIRLFVRTDRCFIRSMQ